MALIFPPTPSPGETFAAPNGITYTWDNTLQVWAGAAGGGGSSVTAASLAEAAAGIIDTKFLSPKTGVPKDAAGMTGAAILPSGTGGQRPGAPTVGMTRVNTSNKAMEFYDGTNWKTVASSVGDPGGWFGHAPIPMG
jgi:hypothetical protein